MKQSLQDKLSETTGYILKKTKLIPKIGLILGSGLGDLAKNIKNPIVFSYDKIPHFNCSTVCGHQGKLLIGTLSGIPVIVMQGRSHLYEGCSMEEIIYPIYFFKKLGVEYFIDTAAVGGINNKYKVGDIIFVNDHINLTGYSPLKGDCNKSLMVRFPDMTNVYKKNLLKLSLSAAKQLKIQAYQGVYIAVQGPSYETPAEVEYFRRIGGDMVGMSVVCETITANAIGIKVIGICYVSNLAAGVDKKPITHEEVLKTGITVIPKLSKIIQTIVISI